MHQMVVSIDNGGSELRIRSTNGYALNEVSEFVFVRDEDFRVKDVEDPMGLCKILKAPKQEYLGIIANGATGRQYDSSALGFDSQNAKTETLNYYRQFIYGLAVTAFSEVSKSNQVHFFSRDNIVSFVIATCIPIKEYAGKKDLITKLKANLAGEYEAEFLLLNEPRKVRFIVSADAIGVLPEGGVAVTAMRGRLREEDYTLVIDMGHVSVDISIFKGQKLYSDKVVSSTAAGSTLMALVKNALADEGYFLNDGQVRKVLETSYVSKGIKQIDVSAIIKEQRKVFVQNFLKKDVIRVLSMNGLNASQIQNVVPIGAAMNNMEEGDSIVDEIVSTCGLEDAEIHVLSDDLRYVNVEMTLIFAKALAASLLKSKEDMYGSTSSGI